MQENFYLGKRRKRLTKGKRIFRFLFGAIIIFLGLNLLFNTTFLPRAVTLAETKITNKLSSLSAQTAVSVLEEGGYDYSDLIHISYTAENRISGVSVNTVALTLLKQKIALRLLSVLGEEDIQISLPVSALLGISALTGKGHELAVPIRTAESVRAGFHSEFAACGMNQTKHTVYFVMEIDVYYILPAIQKKTAFTWQFPAAETVIVGEVPDSLTQISRLTDDISEVEIDDVVDFGHINA